ncbi:MAG: hypothetical protein Greene041679_406 [Parcubacteria group bacterium Greene0416_79]|nr:MAG: hypothetical protein Greene041679_406 [Parcubacteria group bacterium Greene0416_79]
MSSPHPEPLTRESIHEAIRNRVSRIDREFSEAFTFLQNYPRSVTFFGSTRSTEKNEHYIKARRIAGRIATELGYTVLTGGSAGIMEAANRGAFEAGGQSVGLNIRLAQKQRSNRYTTASIEFSYFFVRKVALSFAAEAYLFFPGGFGTLDEFFEIATLVQTSKIRRVPIFLVGKDYWEPLDKFIKENVFTLHHAIDQNDMELYRITDDDEEILATIRKVPVHDGGFHRHYSRR